MKLSLILAEQDESLTLSKTQGDKALQGISQALNHVSVRVLSSDDQLIAALNQAKESLSS